MLEKHLRNIDERAFAKQQAQVPCEAEGFDSPCRY